MSGRLVSGEGNQEDGWGVSGFLLTADQPCRLEAVQAIPLEIQHGHGQLGVLQSAQGLVIQLSLVGGGVGKAPWH